MSDEIGVADRSLDLAGLLRVRIGGIDDWIHLTGCKQFAILLDCLALL